MCLCLLFMFVLCHIVFSTKFRGFSVNTLDFDFDHMVSLPSTELDCPALPPNLLGRLKVIQIAASWGEIERELRRTETELSPGGQFSPPCRTEHRGMFYN